MKTGLVLSGGAAKGFAHIGVLQALIKENIKIDYIAGTSVGALIGAHYALYEDVLKLKKDIYSFLQNNKFTLYDLLKPGYEKTYNKIVLFLEGVFGDKFFSETKIKCSVVATDLAKGCFLEINDGRIKDGVLASISIPGVFPSYFYWGNWLVDGGVTNNLPIDIAKKYCKNIIAVDLGPVELKRYDKRPSRLQSIVASVNIMFNMLRECKRKEHSDVFFIDPKIIINSSKFDLENADEQIRLGEEAVYEKIDDIKGLL